MTATKQTFELWRFVYEKEEKSKRCLQKAVTHWRQIKMKQTLKQWRCVHHEEMKSKRSIGEALKHWTKSMELQALRHWERVNEEHKVYKFMGDYWNMTATKQAFELWRFLYLEDKKREIIENFRFNLLKCRAERLYEHIIQMTERAESTSTTDVKFKTSKREGFTEEAMRMQPNPKKVKSKEITTPGWRTYKELKRDIGEFTKRFGPSILSLKLQSLLKKIYKALTRFDKRHLIKKTIKKTTSNDSNDDKNEEKVPIGCLIV